MIEEVGRSSEEIRDDRGLFRRLSDDIGDYGGLFRRLAEDNWSILVLGLVSCLKVVTKTIRIDVYFCFLFFAFCFILSSKL